MVKTVQWKGQLREIVEVVKETEKAVLVKYRNYRPNWEKDMKQKIKELEKLLQRQSSKEAKALLEMYKQGYEGKMWIPKSVFYKKRR